METNKKIETLIQRTIAECENKGLTVAEAVMFASVLRGRIGRIAEVDRHHFPFKDFGEEVTSDDVLRYAATGEPVMPD